MALQPAGDFEFQQHRAHDRRRGPRQPHQVVDRDRRRPEQRDDAGALVLGGLDVVRAGRFRRGSRAGRSRPRPRIGSSTLMTSAASVTSVAPCLSRPLVPSARGSSGEPGTANTSRPCSPASRAVISEPERRAASTMTTPSASPEISRLRRGKSRARGSQVERHFRDGGAFGDDRRPASRRARADRCARGRRPSTAMVPVARLARWAAASMPRARPETMPKPASPRSRAMRSREFDAGGRRVARADDGDQRPVQDRELAAHGRAAAARSSIICSRSG